MMARANRIRGCLFLSLLMLSLSLPSKEAYAATGGKTSFLKVKVSLRKIEKKTPKYELKVEYPQIVGLKDKTLQDKLNSILKEKALSFLPKDLYAMEKELKPLEGVGYPYYQRVSFQTTYNRGNLLSFLITSESFWGGAHPAHEGLTLNIELTKGKLLGLKDFFPKSAYQKLSKMATKKVQEQKELKGYLLEEVVPIDDDTLFYIKNEKLVIYFPPAVIAAYAAGDIEVPFSFSEIKKMLSPWARKLLLL